MTIQLNINDKNIFHVKNILNICGNFKSFVVKYSYKFECCLKGYGLMPDIIKKEIQNNINLYYIPDKKYKTVSMSVFLHRKLSRVEATYNALLSKILRRGTQKHHDISELNLYAEELYGTLYDVNITKKAYAQSIVSTVNFLSDTYLPESIELKGTEFMLDLIFKPYVKDGAFDTSYLEVEKQNLKDDIEGLVNDKRSYANFRCIEEMCKGEDNAVFEFGYLEDIDAINSENLYEHYEKIITTSPVDIFVVGSIDVEAVVHYVKNYFADFGFNIKPIAPCRIDYSKPKNVRYVQDEFDVNQGKLAMGLRTSISIDDDLYYALLLGNSIFGAGAHSRLFNTVREQMSLCYYASSRLDKFRAIMLISSGIEFDNFEKARDEIIRQLENISKGDFTDEEFAVSRDFVINSYKSYKDSPYLMKDYYLGHCFSSNNDTIDEAIEKISKITKEDVVAAMSNVSLDTVYFLKGRE